LGKIIKNNEIINGRNSNAYHYFATHLKAQLKGNQEENKV